MKNQYFCDVRDIDLRAFSKLCEQSTYKLGYPFAKTIRNDVVIYEGADLLTAMRFRTDYRDLKSELHHCLLHGPGVFIIKGFYTNGDVVDKSSALFRQIIEEEKTNYGNTGDHFAKAGANERIWNSFQKVCERDPVAFVDYYQNPLYGLVSEAWLGPGYQITAQVNVVKPGGRAQSAHRDFHLGFQSDPVVAQYPVVVQMASQFLTLQGAIAHSNMPVESGPTLLLPFSQQYDLGYLAYRDESFNSYFEQHAVQLPLQKGDALFFSPALFHAAGDNHTENDRTANLIQISSAFGKPMETIDRYRMMKLAYSTILERYIRNEMPALELQSIIAAVADGYAFPTNLDVVKPIGGNAPESAAQVLERALSEHWPVATFAKAIEHFAQNRRANG